jgi:NADH-quinone oxidoreductase subunit G
MLRSKHNVLCKVSWFKLFSYLRTYVDFSKVNFVFGNLVEAELALLLKYFANNFGNSNFLGLQNTASRDSSLYNSDLSFLHFFNQSLSNLDNSDLILLIASNLRLEAPLVNARIRKNYIRHNTLVVSLGGSVNLTYYHKTLGDNMSVFISIVEGRH